MIIDWLIHYGIKAIFWAFAAGTALAMLLWVVRVLLWLVVRFPVKILKGRSPAWSEGFARWLKDNSNRVYVIAAGIPFLPLILFVVVVLGGTVGVVTLLFLWLVPGQASAHAEATHDEPAGFWPRLVGRLISIRSMEWPLRLITGVAIAQMLAAAILVLSGPGASSMITLAGHGEHAVQMNRVVFGACVGFLVVAWSFVLTGATEARRGRFVIAAIFTYVTRPETLENPLLAAWLGLIALVWLWLIVMAHREHRAARSAAEEPVRTWRSRLWRLGAMLGLLGGYYLMLALLTGPSTGGGGFAAAINRQVFELAIFLVPVLFLAGVDFAEFAELVSATVVHPVRTSGSRALSAALLVAAAAGIGVLMSWNHEADFSGLVGLKEAGLLFGLAVAMLMIGGLSPNGRVLGCLQIAVIIGLLLFAFFRVVGGGSLWALGAVFAAGILFAWVASQFERSPQEQVPHGHVPFSAVAVAALFLAGAHELVSLLHKQYAYPAEAPLVISFEACQHHDPGPPFSIAHPEGWAVSWLAEQESLLLASGDAYHGGEMYVTSRPVGDPGVVGWRAPRAEDLTGIWGFMAGAEVGAFRIREGWQVADVDLFIKGKRYHGIVWVGEAEGHLWYLGGFQGTRFQPYFTKLFLTMVRSWRPDQSAEAPPPLRQTDLAVSAVRHLGFGMVPVLLMPTGLLLLYLRRKRAEPMGTPRHMAGLFAVTAGLIAFLFLPYAPLTQLWSPFPAAPEGGHGISFRDPLAGLTMVVAVIAVLGMPLLLWRCPRHVAHALLCELLQLLGGLMLLTLGFWLYGAAIVATEHHIIFEAVVLVVALLWELLMSGKDITNVDGQQLRRPTRVLLYVGYLVLVCTAILFYSVQSDHAGHHVERVLEAEEIVRQGIIWLGSPLLVLHALIAMQRARAGEEAHSPPADHPCP